jgi:tetratricopeptide (TPR) repeat protein
MKKPFLLLAAGLLSQIIQGCATTPPPPVNFLDEAYRAENSGRYADMLRYCQQAIEQPYPPPQAFKCIGDANLKLGNRQAAENAYLTYLEKMPADKEVRYQLIDIYFADGRYNNALPQVEKILALHSGEVKALVLLGQIYAYQGDCPQARDAYEEALDRSPRDWDAQAGLNKLEGVCPAQHQTAKHQQSSKPKAKPVVKKETTFQGGGKALREDEW